jgi:hypothetical protein
MPRRLSLAGLILLVVIWSGVLLTPKLRLLLRAQTSSRIVEGTHSFEKKSFARVLRENPNDPRVLAQELEDNFYFPEQDWISGRKAALSRYDKLIEKFPNKRWLIHNRLRLTTTGNLYFDTGETMPRIKRDTKSWLSGAELLQALKMAERGARLEPENSFFDWMRATFLFALKQDEAALKALQDGARKSRFDDGTLRNVKNRLEVRALQNPLIWEERVSLIAAETFPHYAKMRRVNAAAVWRGVLAERKGDHACALKIYGAQMFLGQQMWKDAPIYIGILMGKAAESMVWDAPTPRKEAAMKAGKNGEVSSWPRVPSDTNDTKYLFQIASHFADYARKHGRADLADAALLHVNNYNAQKVPTNWFVDVIFGVPDKIMRPMLELQWTSAMLLRAVFFCILGWLFFSVILKSIVSRKKMPEVVVLDIASVSIFVLMICLILVFIAFQVSNNSISYIWIWAQSETVWGQPEDTFMKLATAWSPRLSLILSFFYCAVVMLWRSRKKSSVLHSEDEEVEVNRAERILGTIAFSALMIAFSLLWWKWLVGQMLTDAFVYPGLTLPLLVGWIAYRIGKNIFSRPPARNFVYAFAWYRSTLGTLAVIGSVAYIACALAALPLRREANAKLDEYVQRGEVAMLREAAQNR